MLFITNQLNELNWTAGFDDDQTTHRIIKFEFVRNKLDIDELTNDNNEWREIEETHIHDIINVDGMKWNENEYEENHKIYSYVNLFDSMGTNKQSFECININKYNKKRSIKQSSIEYIYCRKDKKTAERVTQKKSRRR